MAKTDYKVEKKEELRILNNQGQLVVIYRIWATSAGGTYFHVDVPESDLAKSDSYLTARAKAVDAI